MNSVYLVNGHNRERLIEYCGSLFDCLADFAATLKVLDDVSQDEDARYEARKTCNVLASDCLADMDMLHPMLRDIVSKRSLGSGD